AGLTVNVDVMARGNLSVSASDDGEHYNKLKLLSKSTGNLFEYVHHPDIFYVNVTGYNYVCIETRIPFNIGEAKASIIATKREPFLIENTVKQYEPIPLRPDSYRTSNPRSMSVTSVAKDGTWYGVSGNVFE